MEGKEEVEGGTLGGRQIDTHIDKQRKTREKELIAREHERGSGKSLPEAGSTAGSVTVPVPRCVNGMPSWKQLVPFVRGVNAIIISNSKPALQSLSAINPAHIHVVQQILSFLSLLNARRLCQIHLDSFSCRFTSQRHSGPTCQRSLPSPSSW